MLMRRGNLSQYKKYIYTDEGIEVFIFHTHVRTTKEMMGNLVYNAANDQKSKMGRSNLSS